MAAILDFVNFHRFKKLEKNAIPFILITTMFQMGINKKITFNKHFARKYIRTYTRAVVVTSTESSPSRRTKDAVFSRTNICLKRQNQTEQ